MKQLEQQPRGAPRLCDVWLPLLLAAMCGQRVEAQTHDQALKERFLQEAPRGWEEYHRRAEKLQGTYSGQVSTTINNYKSRSLVEFKANRGGRLLTSVFEEDTGGKQDSSELVYCVNPHYAFRLKRKSLNSAWVVAQLDTLGNNPVPENIAEQFEQHARSLAFPLWVFRHTLAELVGKPHFRIVRCQAVQREGEELVEVVFTSPHELAAKDPVQGGTLLLDPKRFWCLRAYDLQGKTPLGTAVGTGPMTFRLFEPNEPAGSLPVARRFQSLIDWKFNPPVNNQSGNKLEWHIDMGGLREPQHLPGDEQFTLSAFGLPEPVGVGRARPWYLWLGLGGGLCLILGVVFGWLKKRAAIAARNH